MFQPGVDVALSIVSVDAFGGNFVPSVEHRIRYTFKLLNNNEPNLNNDVAEIDRSDLGPNFNFTFYIVDVNLTDSDVINHQLTSVTEQLTADLQTSVNSVESEEFTVDFTVPNWRHFFFRIYGIFIKTRLRTKLIGLLQKAFFFNFKFS